MRQGDDVVRLQFAVQPLHPARHQGAVKLQRQVAKAGRTQGLVGGVLQHERKTRAWPKRPHPTGGHDSVRRRT